MISKGASKLASAGLAILLMAFIPGCQSEKDYLIPVEEGDAISCGGPNINVRMYTVTAVESDSTVYGMLVYRHPPETDSLTTFNYLCSLSPFSVETQFSTISGLESWHIPKGTEITDDPRTHTDTDVFEVNGEKWYVCVSENTFFPAETVEGYPPGPAPFYSEDPEETFVYYMGMSRR